ncbi:lysophospholipid acyltransferase family protein [Hymenobacter chitinivorans]|uniref:1-acyl-sn-glycerol-3-phosphate acyltransferase n=1 Tax=Hymenobacter chitinivorans DSM 11115 TaxID=1121954 RepID=A0A2M9AQL5_9BACT|nr:lysophospholipid acyltransferase family protein [Hymenobacter chitinivorans]PJJ47933.1 1-acyl-sn-glycerol-3-phosphate acyltransferase [Hymenobacter chitinivorans DSM 11115]
MRRLLHYLWHRIYTTWSTFWFVLPFVVTYPIQVLLGRKPSLHRHLHNLNRGWSTFAIRMWGMPVDIVRKQPLPAAQPCIYVANHSSYIDIPVLFKAIPGYLNIIGKSALAKVPLWGPIFGSVYITVNRNSAVSRGRAMVQAKQSLEAGRSVVIFPEGTISKKPGEEMGPFKDGAFQLAIATGVPIVPVSMPLNHRFMPDVGGIRVRYTPLQVVIHEPIFTQGLTTADVPRIRDEAFRTIASAFRPEAAGIPGPSRLGKPKPEPSPAPQANPELELPKS